jgi:hypothetical protein
MKKFFKRLTPQGWASLMCLVFLAVFVPFQLSGAKEQKVPKKVTVYSMVCDSSEDDLSRRVNQMLQDGWKLYGSPTALGNGSYYQLCQSLTKEVEQ